MTSVDVERRILSLQKICSPLTISRISRWVLHSHIPEISRLIVKCYVSKLSGVKVISHLKLIYVWEWTKSTRWVKWKRSNDGYKTIYKEIDKYFKVKRRICHGTFRNSKNMWYFYRRKRKVLKNLFKWVNILFLISLPFSFFC